mgnify:CR=1 FL=1
MFNRNELIVIQTGLIDNVLTYVKKEHYEGVVKIKELQKDWQTFEEMDTRHLLRQVSKHLPAFQTPSEPQEMFNDNKTNIIMFEQMQVVHKIDERLHDEPTFYRYIDRDSVIELELFENHDYIDSFVEYFNHFIELFGVWEENDGAE